MKPRVPDYYKTKRGPHGGGVRNRGVLSLFAVYKTKKGEVERKVPHAALHSPDGMDQGYAGSGPADLARTIIAHYTGNAEPHPLFYQRFKAMFVASAPMCLPLTVTSEQIEAFLLETEKLEGLKR